jgi:hypothetical protein
VARIEAMELDFREVALVGVRPVGRKDLEDAEQEASGEYRTPTGDLTVTSPWGLGPKHLAPIACELTAWTGVRASPCGAIRAGGLPWAPPDWARARRRRSASLLLRKARYGRCRPVRAQPRRSSRRLWQQPAGEFSRLDVGAPRDFARGAAQRDEALRASGVLRWIALDI